MSVVKAAMLDPMPRGAWTIVVRYLPQLVGAQSRDQLFWPGDSRLLGNSTIPSRSVRRGPNEGRRSTMEKPDERSSTTMPSSVGGFQVLGSLPTNVSTVTTFGFGYRYPHRPSIPGEIRMRPKASWSPIENEPEMYGTERGYAGDAADPKRMS